MRADLLALTPEAIATLANMGLVKRAQRDIAAGVLPALEEGADGTVTGTFGDGAVARLVPGRTLKDSPCTCGASSTCRHRVAVALAYKARHAEAPLATETWSPAEISDESLELALGKKRIERARALLAKGLLVAVESGAPPTAKLPSCTVRFLVPREVAYARCDCADPGGCEHVAVAVWAFRQATADGVIALGGSKGRALDLDVLDEALAIVRDLVRDGVAASRPAEARFARTRSQIAAARMVWIESLLVDLEQALDAYRARSALYSAAEVRELVVGLEARARAVRGGGELPAGYVLGEDEAPETLLDHVRLVSLGARLRADGTTRLAEIFLADPDTATVMVLAKRWDELADVGPALARKNIAARISLAQLAGGQLVSKAIRRRANRSLEVGASRANQSSVTPQTGDWGALPPPILVRDLEAHAAARRARPPALLRPRVLAEDVHVVAVREVQGVRYLASEQAIVALLVDDQGHCLPAQVTHRAVAPHAVDAAAAAFAAPVRFVSGEIAHGPLGLTMDVLAIAGDRLVVPDIAPASSGQMDRGNVAAVAVDPVRQAVARATTILEELLHVGLSQATAPLRARVAAVAAELDAVGLAGLGARMAALAGAGDSGAWLDAAVRAALVAEAI